MKLKPFTTRFVENLQPDPGKRLELPDPGCGGLYLVVQTSGKKSWATRYRHGGRPRKHTLGQFPAMGLADARKAAAETLEAVDHGRDPAGEKAAAKKDAMGDRDKVAELFAQYSRRHLSTLKSGRTVQREIERHVISQWGDRNIAEIQRRDVLDLLDSLVDAGKGTTANRVRSYLGTFFSWCVNRGVIDLSPTTGVRKPVKERPRERVLSDAEVRWFWQACERVGQPWGPMGQLLLLTGCRLGEVAGMSDLEIEGDLWQLPGSRVKNGRAHVVPLSAAALEVLAGVMRVSGRAQLVFSTNGETPVSGFHKGKSVIADAMRQIAAEERGEAVAIEPWGFHDLRRSAATGMARLGASPIVVEAALNHVSGARAGVAGIYNRHAYDDEKRHALNAWAAHVLRVAEGQGGNVVEFSHGR